MDIARCILVVLLLSAAGVSYEDVFILLGVLVGHQSKCRSCQDKNAPRWLRTGKLKIPAAVNDHRGENATRKVVCFLTQLCHIFSPPPIFIFHCTAIWQSLSSHTHTSVPNRKTSWSAKRSQSHFQENVIRFASKLCSCRQMCMNTCINDILWKWTLTYFVSSRSMRDKRLFQNHSHGGVMQRNSVCDTFKSLFSH